jgi:hypothetical protein
MLFFMKICIPAQSFAQARSMADATPPAVSVRSQEIVCQSVCVGVTGMAQTFKRPLKYARKPRELLGADIVEERRSILERDVIEEGRPRKGSLTLP